MSSTKKKIWPTPWDIRTSYPDKGGRNVTTLKQKAKYKIVSLDEFIIFETDLMGDKLKGMGCDLGLAHKAVVAYTRALESADMPVCNSSGGTTKRILYKRKREKSSDSSSDGEEEEENE